VPIKTIKEKERFVIEEDMEREVLEDARDYFGSARLLLNEGLGYRLTSEHSSTGFFHRIKRGKFGISVENWNKIKQYAERYNNGERYNPKFFKQSQH
jgi:hypothetical protein